ncbi:MAG: IPT/TIG domain-containing protein, partial [Bacteroidota bacterium]
MALILLIFTIGACKKKYDYDCPKCPLIESISPDSGHFGDIVTINGQNLHPNSIPGGSLTIKFNGTVVLSDSILSSTPSSIRVRVPKGCGSGYVTVDTNPQEGFVNKGTGVHFEYLFRYRWVQKAHFEGFKRYNAVGFSINTRGYIGTGTDGTNDFKDFWQWNQTTNIWTQKADFGSTACSSAIG